MLANEILVSMDEDALVAQLATQQLAAYNAADLDAFCACYADDVIVLGEDGGVEVSGLKAFRARYAVLFSRGSEAFGASVDRRVVSGRHIVEREQYFRIGDQGKRTEGQVLVRYTERDDRIAVVQFFS